MDFNIAFHTDVGRVKKTNQDSLCIKEAITDCGKVLLVAVCDGMGGLEKGELASAVLTNELSDWFENELPYYLSNSTAMEDIRSSWEELIIGLNKQISRYGAERKIQLGSTVTVLLILEDGNYLIGHVGDSRVYKITNNNIQILTEDQTVVANEVKQGRLTPQQAAVDPRRNVLLQCVGASRVVVPEFSRGKAQANECYLLCSDGFRHMIGPDEIMQVFSPFNNNSEDVMKNNIVNMIQLNMQRQERDNITAVLVKIL